MASDILGKSGRALLTAMVKGKENPEELADLAQGQLRLKIPQLVEALRGRVHAVHRFRLQQQLERINFIDGEVAELEAEIEKQNAPMEEAVCLLAEIREFAARMRTQNYQNYRHSLGIQVGNQSLRRASA